MGTARDIAVDFLERAAAAKDQEANEDLTDPVRLLAEVDALTEYANVFRDLPDDHPAVAGLESMLVKVGGDEDAFRKDFARWFTRTRATTSGSNG
jgi:thioredoxin-like negative regulator of GroEL